MKRKQPKLRPDGLRLFQVFRFEEDGTYAVLLEDTPQSSEGMEFVAEVRAKNFLDAHLRVVGVLPEIDDAIRPLVLLLNELGYFTEFSCCGHGKEDGYISLVLETADRVRSLRQLLASIEEAEEDGPCDCEGVCHGCGHESLRFLRDGTALPEGNLFFQLVLPVWCRWEWSLRVGFDCAERAPLPIDYAWLVEQIELRTGRAKPLPPKAEHPSSPLTIARAFDGGRSTLDISLVSWGKP